MIIIQSTGHLTCHLPPIVTFTTTLRVGHVVIPVTTQLDLTGVHPHSHQRVLQIATQLYQIDRRVG